MQVLCSYTCLVSLLAFAKLPLATDRGTQRRNVLRTMTNRLYEQFPGAIILLDHYY